jgi:hypothetical protein
VQQEEEEAIAHMHHAICWAQGLPLAALDLLQEQERSQELSQEGGTVLRGAPLGGSLLCRLSWRTSCRSLLQLLMMMMMMIALMLIVQHRCVTSC